RAVEDLVNEQILANSPVVQRHMPIAEARAQGAMALFGEKYGDVVRVISMGNNEIDGKPEVFSIELCGGTHVSRTGDIGLFRIVQESGIAAGIRRIEAVTGKGALARMREQEATLAGIAAVVKGSTDGVLDKVRQLAANNRQMEKERQQLQQRVASARGAVRLASAQDDVG